MAQSKWRGTSASGVVMTGSNVALSADSTLRGAALQFTAPASNAGNITIKDADGNAIDVLTPNSSRYLKLEDWAVSKGFWLYVANYLASGTAADVLIVSYLEITIP
jgi:hypothetical protein